MTTIPVTIPTSKDSGKFTHGKAVGDEHDSSNDTGSDGETHKTSKLLRDKLRRKDTRKVSTTHLPPESQSINIRTQLLVDMHVVKLSWTTHRNKGSSS